MMAKIHMRTFFFLEFSGIVLVMLYVHGLFPFNIGSLESNSSQFLFFGFLFVFNILYIYIAFS